MSAALKPPPPRMTAEEFLVWSNGCQGDARCELVDGKIVTTGPQTFAHADAKLRIARRTAAAVEAGGLPCRVIMGMGVQTAVDQVFIPDVVMQSGAEIAPDARIVDCPIAVFEILSESARATGGTRSLIGYFNVPSVRHYLIIDPSARQIVHHARRDDGVIVTTFHADEPIRLDPPGIVLEGIFPAAA